MELKWEADLKATVASEMAPPNFLRFLAGCLPQESSIPQQYMGYVRVYIYIFICTYSIQYSILYILYEVSRISLYGMGRVQHCLMCVTSGTRKKCTLKCGSFVALPMAEA